MTNEEIRIAVAEEMGTDKFYAVRKCGYYYRPKFGRSMNRHHLPNTGNNSIATAKRPGSLVNRLMRRMRLAM